MAALEAALEQRSRDLLLLERLLGPRQLAQWARFTAGLAPLPRIACDPRFWQETHELTAAQVRETLADLWESIYPPDPPHLPHLPYPPVPRTVPESLAPAEPPRPVPAAAPAAAALPARTPAP